MSDSLFLYDVLLILHSFFEREVIYKAQTFANVVSYVHD